MITNSSSMIIPALLQILNLLLVLAWLVMIIVALIRLRNRELPPTAKAIWGLIILLIPVLGALAFFIVTPTDSTG